MRPLTRVRDAFTSHALVALLVLAVFAAPSCGRGGTVPDGVSAGDGFQISTVADGFDRPTQLAHVPAGGFLVAELAGAEASATGRVLQVNADWSERDERFSGLDKPTGLLVVGDHVFVMERDRLRRGQLQSGSTLETLVGELPNNGRSQGTLTLTPEGSVLFNTSGRKRGAERVDGSGALWTISPNAEPGDAPDEVARGFKHAYAHTHVGTQLFSVEMSDGTFDGDRPIDELVGVSPGDDGGWPRCVDDNRPVVEYGGTASICAASPRSHALFGPGATPTDVVVAPWDDRTLLVSLWIAGTVVAVPVAPGDGPHKGQIVVSGLEHPQDLLVDGDRVLVVDHGTGVVLQLSVKD